MHARVPLDELNDALERRSGLVGLAGASDMRAVLERAAGTRHDGCSMTTASIPQTASRSSSFSSTPSDPRSSAA
ncbi:MAG TPA: hypothetical protein VGG16_15065 [Streptosporangiaceae bacterium]